MRGFFCFLLGLLIAVNVCGQQPSADVHIAKFNGNRVAAICYSFDDGIRDQYELAYPILKKYGLVATFFVIPSQVPDDEKSRASSPVFKSRITAGQLRLMSDEGMEIASHSWTHSKNLTKLNDQQLADEINKADSALFKITGKKPLTFAYPWNAFDQRTQAAVLKNHIASREFQFGMGSKFTAEMGNSWVDGLIKKQNWGIVMTHAIAHGFDSLSSPRVLDDHYQYVKKLQSQIWVATFADLSKYVKERDSTTITASWGKNKAEFRFNTSLDNKVYNLPLTLVIGLKGATQVDASQGGKRLTAKIDGDKILIDAVPGAGNVILKWKQ